MRSRISLMSALLLGCVACSVANNSHPSDRVDEKVAQAAALYEATFGSANPSSEKMPEAFRLWTELAEAGNAQSLFYLSAAYFRGIPNLVSPDSDTALGLLKKAAEGGYAEAQFWLAWQLESGMHTESDQAEALKFYEQAAKNGSRLAISRLVRIYSNGELGQRASPDKATYWRSRGADRKSN